MSASIFIFAAWNQLKAIELSIKPTTERYLAPCFEIIIKSNSPKKIERRVAIHGVPFSEFTLKPDKTFINQPLSLTGRERDRSDIISSRTNNWKAGREQRHILNFKTCGYDMSRRVSEVLKEVNDFRRLTLWAGEDSRVYKWFSDSESGTMIRYELSSRQSDTSLNIDALPNTDDGKSERYNYKPFSKTSKLRSINGKLAGIFGEPSIGVTLVILITAGIGLERGFAALYRRNRVAGVVMILFSSVIFLSNGFASIGEGPLGWLVWICGD